MVELERHGERERERAFNLFRYKPRFNRAETGPVNLLKLAAMVLCASSQSYKINLVLKKTKLGLNSLTVHYFNLNYDTLMINIETTHLQVVYDSLSLFLRLNFCYRIDFGIRKSFLFFFIPVLGRGKYANSQQRCELPELTN